MTKQALLGAAVCATIIMANLFSGIAGYNAHPGEDKVGVTAGLVLTLLFDGLALLLMAQI